MQRDVTEISQHNKLRILMELRPAMDGFAGIPQETRLLFSAFCDFANVELTGLLNQHSIELKPGLKPKRDYRNTSSHRKIGILSRHVVSHKPPLIQNRLEWLLWQFAKSSRRLRLSTKTILGVPQKVTLFEADHFPDFIWRTLFSKTLPPREFDKVTGAKFAVLRPTYFDMHRAGVAKWHRSYPKVETRGYDVLFSQTPWPAQSSPMTQLVVRYHDAIPMFLPHTIPDTSFHQLSHYSALRHNQTRAIFACTSEYTRQDLLKMFPKLERRSTVIHDMVSSSYFRESGSPEHLSDIIRNRLEPDTQPAFRTPREKESFYRRHTDPQTLRYLIMVSTIEPRKNHMKLISAWEILRARLDPGLKLIIVGRPGWSCDNVLYAMKPWQERGQLFNLSNVPAGDLRHLYNGAEAAICPSIAEGFDLSGIEAMLCGAPVVASDIPVHREVYGEACGYFDPYSTVECASSIEAVIAPDNRDNRLKRIEKGIAYGARYTKESVAPKWEAFWERVRSGAMMDMPNPTGRANPEELAQEIKRLREKAEERA